MNPEELFEKLISNKISRVEFETLLEGLDDEEISARYEVFLQEQFENEIEAHFEKKESVPPVPDLKISKTFKTSKKSSSGSSFIKKNQYPIAAILVVFIGLLVSALFIISQVDSNNSNSEIAEKIARQSELISKTTPKGRKFRMKLSDGSFVHLNSVSQITYPDSFKKNERNVEVMGEVYFEVERDENRPFNIKVKDYSIEVLGTSFNVQAYEGEEDFSVTVKSGAVKINLDRLGNNTITLSKDQKLLYNPYTNVTEVVDVKSDEDLSWREGMLKFESTPMAKVEKMLERWYGIDLVVNNSDLYKKTITGVHQNESIKSVIEALTFATGSKYTVKGNSIIIK